MTIWVTGGSKMGSVSDEDEEFGEGQGEREIIVTESMMMLKKVLRQGKKVGETFTEREKHRKKKKPRNQTPSLR